VCARVPDADNEIDELTRNVTRQPEPAPGCSLDLAADFGFGQLASCVQPSFVPQWYDSALLSQRPRAGPSGLNGLALGMNAATRMHLNSNDAGSDFKSADNHEQNLDQKDFWMVQYKMNPITRRQNTVYV